METFMCHCVVRLFVCLASPFTQPVHCLHNDEEPEQGDVGARRQQQNVPRTDPGHPDHIMQTLFAVELSSTEAALLQQLEQPINCPGGSITRYLSGHKNVTSLSLQLALRQGASWRGRAGNNTRLARLAWTVPSYELETSLQQYLGLNRTLRSYYTE
ncbi:hypothetical protein ACJJTC_003264 [Scirpophaga incertulas]